MTRTDSTYGTSPVKRGRRTKAEMETFRSDLHRITMSIEPATVRGIFYAATVAGVIPKDQNAYKQVSRVLTDMRMDGSLPFEWIVDNTRWMRKPTTYDSMTDALEATARHYRRSLMSTSDVYVEVWCEKDALAGVLYDVTGQYDVPLMVNRGFSSVTYLHEAASAYSMVNKPVVIYYFGDSDSYGLHAEAAIETKLRHFAPDVELTFDRVAVTEDQISEWVLPTRPDKVNLGAVAVELDAIPPPRLRELVTGCVEAHLDPYQVHQLELVEDEEREALHALSRGFGRGEVAS